MLNPMWLIDPGRVIIWVEALHKLIRHFFGYPALDFYPFPFIAPTSRSDIFYLLG